MTRPNPQRSVAGALARNRRLVSALACAFVALVSTLAWPAAPAQAHDELRSSTPSAGARLTAAPLQVRLVFSEKMEPGLTAVALKVADRPAMTLTAHEDGLSVSADVPSGADSAQAADRVVGWTVYYRVVSADGHPVSGSVSFNVASPGHPSASATSGPSVPSSSATTTTPAWGAPQNAAAGRRGRPTGDAQRPISLMLLVGGIVVVAVGAAVWLTRAKP